MVHKRFTMVPEDLSAFFRATTYSWPKMAALFAGVALFLCFINGAFAEADAGAIALYAAVTAVIVVIVYLWAPSSDAKRVMQRNQYFQHEFTVDFRQDGYRQEVHGSSVSAKWADIHDYREFPTCFALYLTRMPQAHVVPKREFTADEIKTIAGLLAANVQHPKKKLVGKDGVVRPLYIVLALIVLVPILLVSALQLLGLWPAAAE